MKEVKSVGTVSQNEQDILRQAAEAAATILPDLEKRVASLKAVIVAYEAVSNGGDSVATPVSSPPRGQVREHIDAILQSGGAYREQEIGKLIAQRFHIVYGRPTIYSALRRGLKAGKYERKERGKWRLKPS